MARKLSKRSILNRIKIRIPPARNIPKFLTGSRLRVFIAALGIKSDNIEWFTGDTIQWAESDNLEW